MVEEHVRRFAKVDDSFSSGALLALPLALQSQLTSQQNKSLVKEDSLNRCHARGDRGTRRHRRVKRLVAFSTLLFSSHLQLFVVEQNNLLAYYLLLPS